MDKTKTLLDKTISRRDALKAGAVGAGLLALGPLARHLPVAKGAPANHTRFVVLNLFGGCDTLNTVVPTTLQPYYDLRPKLALQAAQCLSMNTGPSPTTSYVLHPALQNLASLWAEGSVAVVNRVGYPRANLSHFKSQDIMSYGVRGDFTPLGLSESGWVARYADEYAPTPLGAVSVGVGRPRDFVGGVTSPFLVKSLSSFKLEYRGSRDAHLHRVETAKGILDRFPAHGELGETREALIQAHELSDQVQAAVGNYDSEVVYTDDRPSRYLKDIAVLIQDGFESRIFYTGNGGFDTHSAQGTTDGTHATLLGRLDDGIGSFAADMKAMGTWDDMVVAIITEFGRRNFENGSDGTDHGHGYAEILVGGAVNGGMYGPDITEADLNEKYVPYEVDFRSIYKEILTTHLDADPVPVFPEPLQKETVLGVV
jgi:uncharacterized protein (DUF1501 family)